MEPDDDLARELRNTGFSEPTIRALIQRTTIETVDELRTRPWGDQGVRTGLRWELISALGKRGLAEVEAFRGGQDPRKTTA
jgi:hypothetical protein